MTKQQNKLDRIIIGVKRLLEYSLRGLFWSAIIGRINGPRVIMNSVPKSGTNLLNRVLMLMPGLRHKGIRTIRLWGEPDNIFLKKLNNINNGQYVEGHIQDSQDVFQFMHDNEIKGLIMIRDPRMIVLSHLSYVSNIDTTHRTHKFFSSLPDQNARLDAIIDGKEGVVASIGEVLERYNEWINHPDMLLVRFEELIGPNGGGTKESQINAITNIVKYLGLSVSIKKIEQIAQMIFNSNAPTFRSGQIDGWKGKFSNKQKEKLKLEIGDWLIKYNYESDKEW